jgi:formylglycine-generating enzyme required for sulfatase activity
VRLRLLLLAFVSLFSCWPIWARPEASFIDWQELGSYRIARTETTVAQFRRYAQATGNLTLAERSDGGSEYVSGWTKRSGWNWRTPFGGAQPAHDAEPAVHVTYDEAQAFCQYRATRYRGAMETLSDFHPLAATCDAVRRTPN